MTVYFYITSYLRSYGIIRDSTTIFKDPWGIVELSNYNILGSQFRYQNVSDHIKGTFTFPMIITWRL